MSEFLFPFFVDLGVPKRSAPNLGELRDQSKLCRRFLSLNSKADWSKNSGFREGEKSIKTVSIAL